ncbi:MAG: hypothetical protein A4C66_12335 [Nitrospira sp. HN-bin3]|nr:MAG: hypothetical protein A4C66_12335 [Nitrospira sp. HN-bin3]
MVLRGAQFHRFGPAGCGFLTRRALPSYQTRFRQEQFEVVHPPQEGRMTSRYVIGLYGRDLYWQSHKGLASYGASR